MSVAGRCSSDGNTEGSGDAGGSSVSTELSTVISVDSAWAWAAAEQAAIAMKSMCLVFIVVGLVVVAEAAFNHHEYVGFGTGIVVAERFEVFACFEGLALRTVDVAYEDEGAGHPIALRRAGACEL